MDQNRQVQEIDVFRLISQILRKWWLLLIAAIVVGSCTYFYTSEFVTPKYRASVTIYVNNTRLDDQPDYVSASNLSAAQRLVATYVNFVQSDTVLEEVISTANLDMTTGSLRSMISASQVDETELFKVNISNKDPKKAAYIANALAAVAPRRIEDFIEGSSTKIIDYAKVPTSPYTPNVARNTIIGALAGAAVMALAVALIYHLDARLKEERDVTDLTDLPILGRIPEFALLEEQAAEHERREKRREKEKEKRRKEMESMEKGADKK